METITVNRSQLSIINEILKRVREIGYSGECNDANADDLYDLINTHDNLYGSGDLT